MKLSSSSLIVAALVAMTGSALATHGPLYARTVEQVNSFERGGFDVYPRESVPARTVTVPLDFIVKHTGAAHLQKIAAQKQTEAAREADKKSWGTMARNHRAIAAVHETKRGAHLLASQTGAAEGDVANLPESRKQARAGIKDAEETIALAKT